MMLAITPLRAYSDPIRTLKGMYRMKTTTRFQSFVTDVKVAGRAFTRAVNAGRRTLAAQSWPVLLVAAIVLACILTIIPLAVTLFIAFLVFKYVANAIFDRRPRPVAHRDVE